MVKYLLNFIIITCMLSTFSFANVRVNEAGLQREFGKSLTKVPFFIRFSFQRQYGKDWVDSYYLERKAFLTDYEINLAKYQDQERAYERAQEAQEKVLLLEKNEERKKERDRLAAQLAEEKAQQKDEAERQKAFNTTIKDQEKELQEMEQQITQRGND